MAGFSPASLARIQKELNATPAGNSDFDFRLSTDEISARYLWSEGIEIRFDGARYLCTQRLERSTQYFEIPDEAQAVEKFLRIARHRKAEVLPY